MSYYKESIQQIDKVVREFPHNTDLVLSICNHVNDNQMKTKKWLVDELAEVAESYDDLPEDFQVLIHAGWFGLVGDMIRTKMKPSKVTCYDKDPMCQVIGRRLYPKISHEWGKMEDWDASVRWHDIIVCPSCEHISDEVLNEFLEKKKKKALVCLTSNNYYSITDHINCKPDCHTFANSVKLKIIKECTLDLGPYQRFMVFGI